MNPLPNDNGNPLGAGIHPGRHQSTFRKLLPYIWVLGIFLVVSGGAGAYYFLWSRIREPFNGPTWTVKREKLKVTIVERGTLESADYSDVICKVQARTKGSNFATTIKWVIEDGTEVKQGD